MENGFGQLGEVGVSGGVTGFEIGAGIRESFGADAGFEAGGVGGAMGVRDSCGEGGLIWCIIGGLAG